MYNKIFRILLAVTPLNIMSATAHSNGCPADYVSLWDTNFEQNHAEKNQIVREVTPSHLKVMSKSGGSVKIATNDSLLLILEYGLEEQPFELIKITGDAWGN